MTGREAVLADLAAESAQLDEWLGSVDVSNWDKVTTIEGWTTMHQIAHLHWTDLTSIDAMCAPDRFEGTRERGIADLNELINSTAKSLALLPPKNLLTMWRRGRTDVQTALREVPDGQKIPWFGPPINPTTMATARLMETWAHGHDVGETLGLQIPMTSRARHVCHLGVKTRTFAYANRGRRAPDIEIRVELTGPSGEIWSWGPEDAAERVTGLGHDFALLATRRRHRDDVDVSATGENAADWLKVVQAFAGPPGRDPVRLADR